MNIKPNKYVHFIPQVHFAPELMLRRNSLRLLLRSLLGTVCKRHNIKHVLQTCQYHYKVVSENVCANFLVLRI